MLLRDDRQAALNRIESLCLESADGYAHAATRCADAVLAALFEQAARERGELAAELAPHIRALGDLPSDPDPDREAVGQVIDNMRAYFAADSDGALLEQRLETDAQLEEAIRAGMPEALPLATGQMLARMLETIALTRQRLLERRQA